LSADKALKTLARNDQARRILIICTMGTLTGLVLLDETVFGVVLPTIERELGISRVATHWVVNAYFLTLTCLAALGGKCVDLFGLKPVLVASAALFAVASLLAGFAEGGEFLIAMRAVQGVGAAFLFALSQAGANMAFPPEKRGLGIGIYAAMATVFLAIGPMVGGVVIHYLSWQWVFWFNVPVVLIAGCIAYFIWTDPPELETSSSIDGIGVVLLLIGLFGLVFTLMQGASIGWGSATILVSALIGIAGLYLFDRHEWHRKDPLIDVRLFRLPAFSSAILIFFIGQYAIITLAVFFPIYLQREMDFTAAQAGLAVLPAVLPFPLISLPVGTLADRIGSRPLVIAGTALTAVATLLLGVLLPYRSYPLLAGVLVIWGVGLVCLLGPSRRIAVNAAPDREQGQLSGTIVTLRLFGATIGVAASSAVVNIGLGFSAVYLLTGALLAAGCALALFGLSSSEGIQGPENQ